ncbi:MAG: thioredoxin family protein, partial [Perlucidibaca sp.]
KAENASAFRKISDPAVLDQAIAEARRSGRPVIVDVYADWCVSCVEMQRQVLSRPDVRDILAAGERLEFDITATSEAQLNWLQAHQLFGPPAFLVWNARGEARPPLIGEADHKSFIGFLEKSWN